MNFGHRPPADERIVESDQFIAEALESANIPALMMSIIYLTGDASILDGPARPENVSLANLDGSIDDSGKSQMRAVALDALKAYRDGRALALPPSDQLLTRMMSFVAGTAVADEYLPMMLEEMSLAGTDQRAFRWSGGRAPAVAQNFHTIVIGAGMSGLLAAIRLGEARLPFVVIEKNSEVGGTWFENRYPGCRVDSSNHFYSYSFEPNHDWPEHYSQRDELYAYFDRCADLYDIRQHIRFSTEVIAATFDEVAQLWRIALRRPDGTTETVEANAIISAIGQLNRPKLPEIKGRDTFNGPAFHSAMWEDHNLAGKRIAVIGSGASAFQLIPQVAKVAGKLTVFQRSPGWMAPAPNYHDAVEDGKKWLMKHVPYYARWYRFLLFWTAGDARLPAITIDDAWPHPDRSVNAINDQIREFLSSAMLAQLSDRPDIAEKVIPRYPPFVKRVLLDNGDYLHALTRDNVNLVTEPITEVVEGGLVDDTGRHHPADVIIYATGFETNKFLWPIRIMGRRAKLLSEVWGDTPRAYLGITIPDFPNLFCLYGPGTNLAHGGSIIFHSECQVRYTMGCIKLLIEGGHAAMACKREAYDGFAARLETTLQKMVWSHTGSNNWYRNARGLVVNTSPWRLVDYWNWTKAPAGSDYEFTGSLAAGDQADLSRQSLA